MVAGTGTAGGTGDGGPADMAQLNQLRGVSVNEAGDIFIAGGFQSTAQHAAYALQI